MSSEEKKLEINKRIEELLNYGVVNRHSYFQLKYFVVGKEPTLQSKMWRCIRELQARKESLDAIDLELKETKDNIELANIKTERLKVDLKNLKTDIDPVLTELNTREISILINKNERQKKSLESSLASLGKKRLEVEEEAIYFLRTFESLEKVEKMKPYDDLEEQTKYWNEKITQLANLKVLLHLPLDTEIVQTALSLSDECPIKTEMTKLLEHERLLIEQRKNDG